MASSLLPCLLAGIVVDALVLTVRGPIELTNSGDLSYYADLQLNNQTFKVLIDTGSADLWVAGSVQNSVDTNLTGRVTYAVGAVDGPIKTALLQFGNHTVPAQAFMEVAADDAHHAGVGILGLGPSTGSFITGSLPSPAGSPMLFRLFEQSRTTPNFFTILLGRERDPTDPFPGTITVGEVLPQYPIQDEPQLPIVRLPKNRQDIQHHQILLDRDGLIGPDGLPIPLSSVVSDVSDKSRPIVVIDSGFSLPQVPRSVADAIYGRFHGAEFVAVAGIGSTYILPCTSEVNVTFKFAGKSFPMHPLDMTIDPGLLGLGSVMNTQGEDACIASFQPFTYDRGSNPTYDMVLGMSFMRNAYALFNYGDFIMTSNTTETKPPYIQLLSLTTPFDAHSEFVKVRLGGIDTPQRGLINGSQTTDQANGNDGTGDSKHIAIIASVSVIGALLLLAGYLLLRSRRKSLHIR